MPYVALRSLKVQKADGSMELRKPGDLVPEADSWVDAERWVRRLWIAPVDSPSVMATTGKPQKQPVKAQPVPPKQATLPLPEQAPEAPVPALNALTAEELGKLTKVQIIKLGEKFGLTLAEVEKKDDLIGKVLVASRG